MDTSKIPIFKSFTHFIGSRRIGEQSHAHFNYIDYATEGSLTKKKISEIHI